MLMSVMVSVRKQWEQSEFVAKWASDTDSLLLPGNSLSQKIHDSLLACSIKEGTISKILGNLSIPDPPKAY